MTSMLIGLPCVVGLVIFAQPILNLLYPRANEGEVLLQLVAIGVIFSILNQTISGALQGFGKVMVPAFALGAGCVVKLILNLILLRIPALNVYGAAIATIACHATAFAIVFIVLQKYIKLDLSFKKFVIKPGIAVGIMGVCSYTVYNLLSNTFLHGNKATIISIIFSVIIYLMSVVALKIYSKEDIKMLPKGDKILNILTKMKIY